VGEKMNTETNEAAAKLTSFTFKGKDYPVEFIETIHKREGLEVDTYNFVGDKTRDLAIMRINHGFKTPRQRIDEGERTLEGLVSGRGHFIVERKDSDLPEVFRFTDSSQNTSPIEVNIGDVMQWKADGDSTLVAYEICYPKYSDGRFKDLD
jgi:hypothetical protein